jgi:hypothetical protein
MPATDTDHFPDAALDALNDRKWLVVHSPGSDQDRIVLLPELDLLLARTDIKAGQLVASSARYVVFWHKADVTVPLVNVRC